ncbi:MAG TPA: YtxH domain-containing protein [Chitinophagaceae bacterium]|nr:YtxH domain-containing protein [Chitinophagaceae bacterium]
MGSKLLWGFTLGLLAGLLLAPDKGSETRQRISRKANDLKNKFDDFIDDLSEKFESMKKDAESMGRKAKSEAQSYAGDFPNGTP